MADNPSYLKIFTVFATKSLPAVFVSVVLFTGGIVLLFLKIPGWSMFLGIPAIQIGIVLLIFTFELLGRKKDKPGKDYHMVKCLLCEHMTITPKYMQERICDDCQVRVAQNLKRYSLALFLFFTIPLTAILLKDNLYNRQSQMYYQEPNQSNCVSGIWEPEECFCGQWLTAEGKCSNEKKARMCGKSLFCCYETDEKTYQCDRPIK